MILCEFGKLDNQGRLTIPKGIKMAADLKPGDRVYIAYDIESGKLSIAKVDQSYPTREKRQENLDKGIMNRMEE